MRRAFVFPGQGSQYVGMTEKIEKIYPAAREIFSEANRILNLGLYELTRCGPEEELNQTENAQPAILMTSVAWAQFLMQEGVEPCFCCGHSLGEFSALVVSGAIDLRQALQLVRKRGELMSEQARANGGGMTAVIGLEAAQLREIVSRASVLGIVGIANWNGPDQVVLSGEKGALLEAAELARCAGAKLVKPLPVSAPFHSPLMKKAAEQFRYELEKINFGRAHPPVLMNVGTRILEEGPALREALFDQMEQPVYWTKCVEHLRGEGVEEFIEVGPKNVLRALVKKICPDAHVEAVENIYAVN